MENFFTPLNNLIKLVYDAGLSGKVYNVVSILTVCPVALFCFFNRKKYDIKASHSIIAPAFVYVFGISLMYLIGWAETGFKYFGNNNIVKGFCFFPIFAIIISKILKVDKKRMLDFLAPAFSFDQFVAHQSCIFAGCCHGYPMEHGIYNPRLGINVFPSPLLESLVALLVAISCILYERRNNYEVTGRGYPFFLITFGATRFLLEFLRDNNKLFWGISDLAFWALLMVVVGTVWMTKSIKNEKFAKARAEELDRLRRKHRSEIKSKR